MNFFDDGDGESFFLEVVPCTGGADHMVSQLDEARCQAGCFFFIPVAHGDQNVSSRRNVHIGCDHCFVEGFLVGMADAITSPVDFISGPSLISTSPSLEKENMGALMAT